MPGLWTAFLLMVQVTVADRQPWIEPLPGVRMEPARPVRSEADFGPDSAYRLLLQATESREKQESVRAEAEWDCLEALRSQPRQGALDQQTRTLLREGEESLVLARRAAVATDVQMPTDDSWFGGLAPLSPGVRHLSRLLVLSAYAKEGQGDLAGALEELLVCIRCGSTLSRGQGMIGYCVDSVVSALAVDAMHRIVVRNEVPAPVLRRYAQELLQVSDQVEPCVEAIRHEARQVADTFDHVDLMIRISWAPLRGLGGERVHWLIARGIAAVTGSTRRAMQRDVAALYQHYVQLASLPYSREVDAQFSALPPPLEGDVACRFFRVDDSVGLFLVHRCCARVAPFVARVAERDAILRGMALFLAIRAYEAEQRRPPLLAADLVPEFLPRIPLDPFDGQPFRYVCGKVPASWGGVAWGIYSIGRDFTDDGGRLPDPPHIGCQGHDKPPCDAVWIPRIIPDK